MTAPARLIHRVAAPLAPADDNTPAEHLNRLGPGGENLPDPHALTRGLGKDRAVVDSVLTPSNHNGGTEGVDDKLKLIKRQMCSFGSLLRHRAFPG